MPSEIFLSFNLCNYSSCPELILQAGQSHILRCLDGFVPYGRGGSGFSVLDVTDPAKPEHLVSIYNDMINNQVYICGIEFMIYVGV